MEERSLVFPPAKTLKGHAPICLTLMSQTTDDSVGLLFVGQKTVLEAATCNVNLASPKK